jgi:curved DNA-binding protein CbpA
MIDYFALLQQPRRPWLDPQKLKETYQQLTLVSHPDRQSKNADSNDPGTDFTAVNEAYRVLTNPKFRLQHLLSLEGHIPITDESAPGDLMELFSETGTLIREIDRLLEKLRDTNNALSASLLRSDILDRQKRAKDLLDKLKALYNGALQELRILDEAWLNEPQAVVTQLDELYRRFAYLTRWTDQLEERRFQLSI